MPFDGNGNWTSALYPIDDRDNGVAISADKFNELIQNNLTQSFANCMTTDSQTKPIADIDANNYKVKNVADPTLAKDAVNKQTLEANNALADGSLWVGNEDGEREEITQENLSTNLGLDISLPINDTILYNNATVANTVTWQGTARSDDNTTNIVASTAITSPALSGGTGYIDWYLFVGFDNDTDKNVNLEWDTDIDGSNLSTITGAKRRIGDNKDVAFPTDISGDLAPFERNFGTWEFELWSGSATSGVLTLNNNIISYSNLNFEMVRSGNIYHYFDVPTSKALQRTSTSNYFFLNMSNSASSIFMGFYTTGSNELTITNSTGINLTKITGVK